MQFIKSKFFRTFISLSLAVFMTLSTCSLCSAKGTEKWSANMGPWEKMRVTDCNTTPIKTIKKARKLELDMLIYPCKDWWCECKDNEPDYYSDIKVHVIIKNAKTKEILANKWLKQDTISCQTVRTKRALKYNEQIQIYTDVCSVNNPPGKPRKAHIEYRYSFI